MMQVFCGIVLCVAVAASALAQQGQAAADSLKGGEMVKIEGENHRFYIDKYEVTNEEYAAFLTEKGNAKVEGMYWVELRDAPISSETRMAMGELRRWGPFRVESVPLDYWIWAAMCGSGRKEARKCSSCTGDRGSTALP